MWFVEAIVGVVLGWLWSLIVVVSDSDTVEVSSRGLGVLRAVINLILLGVAFCDSFQLKFLTFPRGNYESCCIVFIFS